VAVMNELPYHPVQPGNNKRTTHFLRNEGVFDRHRHSPATKSGQLRLASTVGYASGVPTILRRPSVI
jgi:hypothetical protein